jgi:hypothetical protein
MNTSRHHADWLSLVEVSGPFISLPVLLRVFPQGLEARDPAQAKALRAAYDEWQANPAAPGLRRAWILQVLTNLLGYPADLLAEGQTLPAGLEANIAQMGETLRPDFALTGPKNSETEGQAHLLIAAYPSSQKLDRPLADRHWKANPATRMTELLHATGVSIGLVTNGEHWMLVYAPRGETSGYASWYGALWLDEPITLRAFHSLLGVRRFFGVDAANTLLGLLKESASDQQEVTDQLGYQVREAVQVLVQAFDMLDQDANRTLLKGLKETDLYDSALTVMMRLVFLFSAEERGLLHLGKPLYDDNYAVSTLMEQLQEVADLHGPQVLERRCDAWARLLATFRAVHGGVHHQDLMMPAYGGSLFDPDRYPFLEGRAAGTKWVTTPAELLNINNRVVLHLLSSLQRLRMKVPGGGPSESRRISFRALGVEQIGHVYEGLLDHTAVRATEPVLGILGTRGKDAEIPLAKLETILAKRQEDLVEFLHDETGRTEKAIKRALDEGTLNEEHRLLISCGHDAGLFQRVRAFAGLIREDSFERPMVVLPGSVYVTAGTTRRSTGTHYTPPSLTEPIVQHTLEPLVFRGPSEGLPQSEWQHKSPKEILDLKVCDMAMGSGAFLVQVCRYLSERLAESWENEEKKHPNEFLITPEGGFSEGAPSERLIPADATERLAIARRIVADRCLYGVDINPMAVEMSKLSMWLITLDAKRPFTFLDHAFKCGDSLLGLSSFKQLEDFSLRPEGVKQVAFSTMNLWRHVDEAKKKRQMLEAMPSDTPQQVAAKAVLYAEAEEAVVKLKAAADVLLATELVGLKGKRYDEALESAAEQMMFHWTKGTRELCDYAQNQLNGRKVLHWPLVFPEISEAGGFDAFVGNPPFLGGRRISFRLSSDLLEHLKGWLSGPAGTTDLCIYFLLRADTLASSRAHIGLVLSDIISQGESRINGLEYLLRHGVQITSAVKSTDWPGQAGVKIALIHLTRSSWQGVRLLNEEIVTTINSYLQESDSDLSPKQLESNSGVCFSGHYLMGQGFVLTEAERDSLIRQNASSQNVIFPYIKGDDINNELTQSSGLYAINFSMRDLDECERDYPECVTRIRNTVKPERDEVNRKANRERWWRYAEARPGLERHLSNLGQVIVQPFTAKYLLPTFVDAKCVFAHPLVVIVRPSFYVYAVLQSAWHEKWVWQHCSTSLELLRYTASTVLETFPFPKQTATLESCGKAYYLHRQRLINSRRECLTEIYNSFHRPEAVSEDIVKLRDLQRELDHAVADAFDWIDFNLGHGFHETKQGIRYTISEEARLTVLSRLLKLNHERRAEEIAEEMLIGKQPKATGKRGRKAKVQDAHDGVTLFSEVGD